MSQPRVFIGSSVESLPIADAISENLEYDAAVTIWRAGTFSLSSTALDDLVEKAKNVDFSIFIFSPDDLSIIRDREEYMVRDNVIFELGLFIGTIGKERCFIVKPRDVDLHFPSDLLGMTSTDYDATRSDNDLVSALNYASNKIKREFKNKGTLSHQSVVERKRIDVNSILKEISESDLMILGTLLESMNENITGCSIWSLKEQLEGFDLIAPKVDLQIVKLERLGLLQRANDTDFNGNEGFFFALTDYGVDICLKNEDKISELFLIKNLPPQQVPAPIMPPLLKMPPLTV